MSVLPEREFDSISGHAPVILAGYGRFGQIIGRFLRAQDIEVTVLEKDPEQIDAIRKFGVVGYYGDASRLDLLKSAGAEHAKLLIVAVDDVESCLEIVKLAREEFPNLTVFARARNRRHAYDLARAGVHYFKREMFDSSLTMAKEAMVLLGKSRDEMELRAKQFQTHDEKTLEDSFDFFEEEDALINFSQKRASELEQVLRSDPA